MNRKIIFLASVFLLILITTVLIVSFNKTHKVSKPDTISKSSLNSQPAIPALSVEQIFADDHRFIATLPVDSVRVLVATGDVIPARSVNYQTVVRNNFRWPYEYVSDILQKADVTFINLESPLISNCPLTNEGMKFCGDIRHIGGLLFAGVDVASLANNHMGNYGKNGVDSTASLLRSADILPVGTGSPIIKKVRDLRFAFLSYNDVEDGIDMIVKADEERIVSQIKEAKKESDVVIVAFHWGIEYTNQPTERQQKLAHLAVDAGADLVLGNHPHWIQPIEIYKNRLIAYAHGNLVFDQMWSEKTKEGVIGRYTFYNNELVDAEFIPTVIYNFGQPRPAESERKRQILEEMKKESVKLKQ